MSSERCPSIAAIASRLMPRLIVVPPESWRASLCGFPVGGRGVLVVDRAHHARGAVPAVVVVEAVAPVQYDGLGVAGVGELVAGEDLPLQGGEERLGCGVVEAR